MNKLAKRIGKNINRLRVKRGLTMEKLAYENDLSKGYLSEIEHGKKLPSLAALEKISDGLGVDIKELFESNSA